MQLMLPWINVYDLLPKFKLNCRSINISILEVFNGHSIIGFDLASRPDLIPLLFLYMSRFSLTIPVNCLFTLSLCLDIFPNKWKFSCWYSFFFFFDFFKSLSLLPLEPILNLYFTTKRLCL